MPDNLIFSFPHMGNYHIPVTKLLRCLFPGAVIMPPPETTNRTLSLGAKHSPDFVCSPFKYNMGNFIEALENGANVLLQTGTGCRFGYYGEVQEQILRDLGYDFKFVCFSRKNASVKKIYKICRSLGSPLGFAGFIKAVLSAVLSIHCMDKFENYMRENMGFETKSGSFSALYTEFLKEFNTAENTAQIFRLNRKYMCLAKRIELKRPDTPLRVGIVGELFTLMEPFSNFYLERELSKAGIAVSRKMSVSFLLFKHDAKSLRGCGKYLKYMIGANGADSISQTINYMKSGYDGIIHMKSFGCTPELSAMPVLSRISGDFSVPVLSLSFDSHTSETGVETRLEAFADMIKMRRDKINAKSISRSGYRLDFN